MDTRNLESFAAVYECGSITKAAERLFVSPQGLAKSMTRLEAELGHELFMRSHQGVTPTAYARALYLRSQELASLLEAVEHDAEVQAPSEVRVHSVSGVLPYLGPSFMDDFRRAHPDVSLVIDEGNDERVADLLLSGRAEIGLLSAPVDPDLFDLVPFSSHPHVLVVGEHDPLASKDRVSVEDLSDRVVATQCGGYAPHRGIRARLAARGIKPRDYVGFAESYTGFFMAATGLAVCINTDYASFLNLRPDVRIVRFDDPTFTWDTFIVWRKGASLGAGAAAFRDFAPAWLKRNKDKLFSWPEGY